jgi:hypothetical protein
MNARRSRTVSPRPQTTTPTTLSLRSSTAGWYAEWKARKQAAPAPAAAAPEATPADAAAEALARWLTADSEK